MATVEELSDIDLRKALIHYGVNAGPITPTTRNVYRKKLEKVSSDNIFSQQTVTTTTSTETYQENFTEQTRQMQEDQTEQTQQIQEDFTELRERFETPERVNFTHVKKVIKVNEPPAIAIPDSPYHYAPHDFPSDDGSLRRRPLYTPGGTLRSKPLTTKAKINTVNLDHVDVGTQKSSFPWCRLLVAIIVIVIALVLIVYYHMEHNHVKDLLMDNKIV